MRSLTIRKIVFPFFVCCLLTTGCSSLKNTSKPIVTVDNIPVSTEEFLYVFQKNNINQNQEIITEKDLREYLDLFVNFKLKVREAESLGLQNDSAFIKELEGYRQQLAQPYLTETALMDSMVQVTYQRLNNEVSASHILIAVSPEASPADSLNAYNRISDLRKKITEGADFNALAYQFSEDPSARSNKGHLGYFTAMQMVSVFEDAAFSLPVGSISEPIRTRFGYHLIKVHDKRPSQGKIQVSHILVRANDGIGVNDSLAAAEKAREIYQLANSNEDWNKLCRQFSEDTGTRMKGGTLPWFKTGDVSNIPNFENAAFALQETGDISEPVKTPYGWHIIRLDGRQGLEPLEELEPRIKESLSRNSRGDLNREALIKRLKKENNFVEMPEALALALSGASDSLASGQWTSQTQWQDQHEILFRINDHAVTIGDFYRYLESSPPLNKGATARQKMTFAYQQFWQDQLIAYEEDHLAEKYPEYKMLVQEYRDGLLLFELMEERVWNRAMEDTTGLEQFFHQNQHLYQWGPRVDATLFNAQDQMALKQVEQFLEEGQVAFLKYDFSGTEKELNKAQTGILDNIAQQLLQGSERYLVMIFPPSPAILTTRELVLDHLAKYNLNERVKEIKGSGQQGFIIYVASTAVQDLAEKLNKSEPLTLQIESGRFQKGDHELVDQTPWETGTKVFPQDGRLVLVHIERLLPPGDQRLDEIKGRVISDYQEQLEKEWVAQLKNKYPVTLHEKVIKNVYEQYEK